MDKNDIPLSNSTNSPQEPTSIPLSNSTNSSQEPTNSSQDSTPIPRSDSTNSSQEPTSPTPNPSNKPKKVRLLKRIKRWLFRILVFLSPYIYKAYCKFVWMTSKVEDQSHAPRQGLGTDFDKSMCLLWHQDVFFVPWAYGHLQAHTIASISESGDIITRLLELCQYTVFRGGSSKSKKRNIKILDEFNEYFLKQKTAIAGLTVDGSSGPKYRMKHGGVVIAVANHAAVFVCRAWCKRKILAPTWDNTTIPLPFNRICMLFDGPYFPPTQDIHNTQAIEKFRHDMELKLADLTYAAFLRLDEKITPELLKDFPPDWKIPCPNVTKD